MSTSAELYLVLATQRLAAGDEDGAERVVREGLAAFPAAEGFHLKLGVIHSRRGDLAEAYHEHQWELLRAGPGCGVGEEAARRSAELVDAGSEEIQRVMAALAALADGRAHEAVTQLEAVGAERGERFALRMFLASARHAAGELSTAEADYRALIEQDAHFRPAYVELAKLLRTKGHREEAAALMHRAPELDPQREQNSPGGE